MSHHWCEFWAGVHAPAFVLPVATANVLPAQPSVLPAPVFVFPAQAGNPAFVQPRWSPAFAGETSVDTGETCADTGETSVVMGETRVVPRELLRQKLNEWAEMLEDRTGLEAREVGA